jgi:hypothetical protein
MRIQKLFFLMILGISMTQMACKKDNDTGSSSIVGKWTLQNIKTKVTTPGLPPVDETTPGNGETAEFKSNGIVTFCESDECEDSYYKISGKTLTISDSQDFSFPDEYTIQTQTGNSLVLYQKYTETIDALTITTEITLTLSK